MSDHHGLQELHEISRGEYSIGINGKIYDTLLNGLVMCYYLPKEIFTEDK